MCVECGCESLGSETGIVPVAINDQTSQGDAGLTLSMTSTYEATSNFGMTGN